MFSFRSNSKVGDGLSYISVDEWVNATTLGFRRRECTFLSFRMVLACLAKPDTMSSICKYKTENAPLRKGKFGSQDTSY